MAGKVYHRQILLHTNSSPEVHTLNIKLKTALLPIERKKTPYVWLALLLGSCLLVPIEINIIVPVAYSMVIKAIADIWNYTLGG